MTDFDVVFIVLSSYAVSEVFWEDADEEKTLQIRAATVNILAVDSYPCKRKRTQHNIVVVL